MQNHDTPRVPPVPFRQIGDGPGVLLVHGWMVSGRVWDRMLPLLPGYRFIVPDLHAQRSDASLDAYLADLVALCDTLDLHDAHLVGHSMGGQLAALLATRLPHRFATLTLMNPVPVQGLDFPAELQPVFRDCGGDRERVARVVDMSCLQLDANSREQLIRDGMATDATTVADAFDAFRNGDANAQLNAAQMPTAVIATDDPFLPAEFLQTAVCDRLPRARLVRLAGPGHYPQLEAPEETAALLRGLLA